MSTMPLFQASVESGLDSTNTGDTFDWTINQVVHALCGSDDPSVRSKGLLSLPPSDNFASVLREHEIDGEALLTGVNEMNLEHKMGIKAVGRQTKILNFIESLQHQSVKYQQKVARQSSSRSRFSSVAQMSHFGSPWGSPVQTTFSRRILPLGSSIENAPAIELLGPGTSLPQSSTGMADANRVIDVSSEIHPEFPRESKSNREKETTIMDAKGETRRRLVLGSPSGDGTRRPARLASILPEENFQEPDDQAENALNNTALHTADEGTHLPSSSDDSNSQGRPDSDTASFRNMPNDPVDEVSHPGQPQLKRIQPTLISEPLDDIFEHRLERTVDSGGAATVSFNHFYTINQSALGKRAKRDVDQIYLGPSALPVDNLFYGEADFGTQLEEDAEDTMDEFSFQSGGQKSDAQRLYVSARMKYFLQGSRERFVKDGGQNVGIVTYPDRIARRNQPLSITLFSRTSNAVSVTRVNRARWIQPTSQAEAEPTGEEGPSDVFKVADPALALDVDDGSWDALEKWNHMDNDETLPMYGDSGSEGEYDLETWREMEAEHGTVTRPEGSSRSPKLTKEEVDQALGIAIDQIRNQWRSTQRPKMQHKAWRLWAKARRDRTAQIREESLEHRLRDLERRIESLTREIHREEWSKPKEVMRQAKIMQPSVFEHEECQWKLEVLQSKKAPQKLPTIPKKPRTQPATLSTEALKDGEEDLESEKSSIEESDPEDGLDDFIIDDEVDDYGSQLINADDDTIMADIEDAVDSDTLIVRSKSEDVVKTEEDPPCQTPLKIEKRLTPSSKAFSSFIDLEQASDPTSPAIQVEPSRSRIVTPPLHSDEDSDVWFQRSRGKKPIFKPPPTISIINLDTDSSDHQTVIDKTVPSHMPPFDAVRSIRALSPTELIEKQDRKRLLVWLIAHTKNGKREQTSGYVDSVDLKDCSEQVITGLETIKSRRERVLGVDKETSESILQVAAWYVGWTIPVKSERRGINMKHIDTTLDNVDGFEPFWEFMLECLGRYELPDDSGKKEKGGKPARQKLAQSDLSDSALDQQGFASDSQETVQKRDVALQRMREDDQRKRQTELKTRMSGMSDQEKDPSEVILNPGKLDELESIRLNPLFGQGTYLRPHQQDGLQFMWREITGDHDDLQGCLLAQTMGLGKTVQVIALLVAISDAANSPLENVRDQIPVEVRDSRTLVLCPPALIENWSDEFLLWPPTEHHLGTLRKVSAALRHEDRLHEIRAWARDGGILLLGYTTFRDLVLNKPRQVVRAKSIAKVPITALNDEEHHIIKTALLEGPNIVIADEAHEFKNQTSGINQAINQIKCKSRVAMTGSPLSNSLGEYFSMIDWIAPGYLGSYAEFKDTYEGPIKVGLFKDSAPWQYRNSRKRLKALELELEPKVHRADFTALHGQLNGKSEFVVRVPLTAFQESLYRCFIESLDGVTVENGPKIKQTQLWSWLSVLQLLCNHPKSFHEKAFEEMKPQKGDAQRKAAIMKNLRDDLHEGNPGPSTSASDEDVILDDPLTKSALRRTFLAPQDSFMKGIDIDSLALSNKMQTLMSILELSESAHDKVLVFSHRIGTLDYVGNQLGKLHKAYTRIDGKCPTQKRQELTKAFNEGDIAVCLISTRAGGQGLNLFGANRVVILDNHFSPMWEQQAVGRAYRIGQRKHVFVYRLTAAGTFEEEILSQALFKEQLATRVVDGKNPERQGLSGAKQYLFLPKHVEKDDLEEYKGKDVMVLDHLLDDQEKTPILSITPSETFYVDDGEDLTDEERKEAEQMLRDEQLRRRNYVQYLSVMQKRRDEQNRDIMNGSLSLHQLNPAPSKHVHKTASDMIARSFTPMTSSSPHDVALPAAPSPFPSALQSELLRLNQSSGEIQPMPAHIVSDVNLRLEYSIANLFPSKGPGTQHPKEHLPIAVREEVKADIFGLISSRNPLHGPLKVVHPHKTLKRLLVIMCENAKDESDYRRIWRGIRILLVMNDVHPDELVRVMVEKLGEPGAPWPEHAVKKANSLSTIGDSHPHQQVISSSSAPTSTSAMRALNDRLQAQLERERTNAAKRSSSRGSADSERPAKKPKSSTMASPTSSGIGAMEDQFNKLLESAKKRGDTTAITTQI